MKIYKNSKIFTLTYFLWIEYTVTLSGVYVLYVGGLYGNIGEWKYGDINENITLKNQKKILKMASIHFTYLDNLKRWFMM